MPPSTAREREEESFLALPPPPIIPRIRLALVSKRLTNFSGSFFDRLLFARLFSAPRGDKPHFFPTESKSEARASKFPLPLLNFLLPSSLTGDVNVELVLDILAAVVQDALVGALVLLLEVLNAQDDGAGLAVGPGLEATALALRGQVFEALVREDGSFSSFEETETPII